MQQHPVPQNVTQYQFRLVGDMTLKQFLELAGGILLAYLFYASNLIFIFKWPLALLSLLLGIALAFFPIEDRPLDTWVTNFLKSIYGPTRFIWKKTNKTPSIFTFAPTPTISTNAATKTIKAPVAAAPTPTVSDLSAEEFAHLNSLDSLFSQAPTPTTPPPTPNIVEKPSISIRKLGNTPTVDLNFRPRSVAETPQSNSNANTAEQAVSGNSSSDGGQDSVIFSKPSVVADAPVATSSKPSTVNLPASPTLPNLVTGVVVDPSGKLVESAIVQILDGTGIPARALKTNSLGRFMTATPLSPGTYTIEVDKLGLTFAPQSLTINNSVVPAIELRAS